MKPTILRMLMLAVSVVSAKADQRQISGKWAADDRTKGGLGTVIIFTDDGSVTNIFGELVDFKYRVEGETIIQTYDDPSTGTSSQTTLPYSIVGDKLTEVDPANAANRLEMTRVGTAKPGVTPIVGLWTYKHYTGVMATVQFTRGGLEQLSVPMTVASGRYKLQTGELTMEIEGQPPSKRKIVLSGDHLTFLADAAEHEQKFTRIVP